MATREDILKGLGNPQQLQAEHEANQAREAEQRSYEEGVKLSVAAVPRAQQKREMNGSSSQASEVPSDNSAEINQRHDSFRDWLDRMHNVESPEQARKRERRDRARRIISAVGDGITSIANMYFANNGGIPLVKPQLGQTLNKRLQEERAYREANRDRYVNAYMRNEANRRSELRDDNLSRLREENAAIRAAENERKAAADADRKANQEEVNRLKKRQLDLRERELNIREDYNNKRISNQEFDNETKRIRAEVARNNQRLKELGEETTITSTDKYGNKTEKTVVKVPAGGGSEDSGSSLSSGGSGKDYSQYKQKDFSKYKRNNK